MKFAAIIDYIPDAAKVAEIRPTHRQYLGGLLAQGKLFAAGPILDDGALIIYEVDTAADAEALIQADPFNEAGVFVRWTVRPWKCVMGNPALMPS